MDVNLFSASPISFLPFALWLTAAGIAGLLWGSFAASFAYRWPRAVRCGAAGRTAPHAGGICIP